MPDLLLAVDIGNSYTKLARWRGTALDGPISFLPTNPDATANELAGALRDLGVVAPHRIVIGSVVPDAEMAWAALAERTGEVELFLARGTTPTPLTNRYRTPERLGVDRLAAAVGAWGLTSGAAVVIHLGTATTVDGVSAAGEYLGGAIAPGVSTAAKALLRDAARLPQDWWEQRGDRMDAPPRALGLTTEESLDAGLVFGMAGLVKELGERVAAELGGVPRWALTGWWAPLVAPLLGREIAVVPHLILDGLRRIWLHNRP